MDQLINITMEQWNITVDQRTEHNDVEVLFSLRVGRNRYAILGPIR